VTDHPERQFVAITDPGTPLATLAAQRKFRRCVLADPEVGGRYSALTAFGLVPAALIGVDLPGLLASARAMAMACGPDVSAEEHPGLRLGALLGELARAGRDKVTFETSPTLDAFPAWAEQLIAESTGKSGTGIVPVAGEVDACRPPFRADLVLAYLGLAAESQDEEAVALRAAIDAGAPALWTETDDPLQLGGEFFRWEFGVALSGAVLGIDPFDQPDVEIAKELARQAMEHAGSGGTATPGVRSDDASTLRRSVGSWASGARTGDYVAIQAYLEPSEPNTEALQGVRVALHRALGLATTLGFGPRFLHSTGQLHKGGPPTGLYVQVVDEPREDLPLPGSRTSFGAMIRAQAVGDASALARVHRRVLTVNVGVDPVVGLGALAGAIAALPERPVVG
jgi:transaldolase/glucose-6-phosphate isomerase